MLNHEEKGTVKLSIRAVGAILQRRHIHRYVEEHNHETSVQQGFWV